MIRPFAHSLNFNFNVSEPDTWQHYVISLNGFLQGKFLWRGEISLEGCWGWGFKIRNAPETPLLLTPAHPSLSLPCTSLSNCTYNQNCSSLGLYVALKAYKPTLQHSAKFTGAENLFSFLEHSRAPTYVLGSCRWVLGSVIMKDNSRWG